MTTEIENQNHAIEPLTGDEAEIAKRLSLPSPGIYPIPFAEYRAWPAVNKSALDSMYDNSPMHCHYRETHPQPETESLRIGRAFHALVLEPDKFENEYLIADGPINPKTNRPYGSETKAFAEWRATVTQEVLSPADSCKLIAMRNRLFDDELARKFIGSEGDNELSLLWLDEDTGLMCKARLDMSRPSWATIGDLKTTADASKTEFEKSCWTYGYHRQAAHYLDGAKACGLGAQNFAFACVEKEPPYGVACYRMQADAVDLGRHEMRKLLRTYADCKASGIWPGYESGFKDIGLPAWAMRQAMKAE